MSSVEIAPRSCVGFTLQRGQQLTIIDRRGGQVADLLAYHADDIAEVLSSGCALAYASKLFRSTGDMPYSHRSNPMLRIVLDDVGRHDFLLTPCS
jgi:uncharacterized protein